MELIEIELSEFTQRSRSLSVAHASTDLARGLEYGERVLVHTGTEYRTAVVVDIDFSAADTHYRLVLGGWVANDVARSSLIGEIDVLGRSAARSGAAHGVPVQRQVARRLQQR